MTQKYRGDHIGSRLRPEAPLAARRGHDAGDVTDDALREVEASVAADGARFTW